MQFQNNDINNKAPKVWTISATIELFHHVTVVALAHTRKLAGVQVFLASEAMELSRYAETLSCGAKAGIPFVDLRGRVLIVCHQ